MARSFVSGCLRRSLFADVFVPHFGIFADVFGYQQSALFRIEVEDPYSERAQPIHPTLKIAALTNHHRTKAKLANQTAAVPARSERSDHGEIAVAALATGIAKCISLAMRRRITILHTAVVTEADEFPCGVKDRGSDRNASFGEAFAGLRQRHREHCRMIKLRHD